MPRTSKRRTSSPSLVPNARHITSSSVRRIGFNAGGFGRPEVADVAGAGIPPVLECCRPPRTRSGTTTSPGSSGPWVATTRSMRSYGDHPGRKRTSSMSAAALHDEGARRTDAELDPGDDHYGGPDEFGAFTLYLTLAGRLDPAVALRAAEGWAEANATWSSPTRSASASRLVRRGHTRDTREIGDAARHVGKRRCRRERQRSGAQRST